MLKHGDDRLGATRLHCTVPVEPFNASNQVCDGLPEIMMVPSPVMVGTGVMCIGASVGQVYDNGFGPFSSVDNNLDVGVSPDCTVRLTFQEQFPPNDTRYLDDYVLRVDLNNGHSLLLPLFIELQLESAGCQPGSGSCQLEGAGFPLDESFLACGRL
jgi:hypothetical protein